MTSPVCNLDDEFEDPIEDWGPEAGDEENAVFYDAETTDPEAAAPSDPIEATVAAHVDTIPARSVQGSLVPFGAETTASKTDSNHSNLVSSPADTTQEDGRSNELTSDSSQGAVAEFEDLKKQYPLHYAAWYNDVDTVKRLLQELSDTEQQALDAQGNTVLHVAILRQHVELTTEMVDLGYPTYVRNNRGWSPLMEAVETRNRKIAHLIARTEITQVKAKLKAKKQVLLRTLNELPDFSMKMSWELGSNFPGLGMLIKRYAPHDTYTLWKKGATIRVDGTLMGVDRDSKNIIPEWKRGHFSLIYDGTTDKPQTWFLNHKKKKFVDITEDRRKFKGAEMSHFAREVDEMLDQPQVESTKMRACEFKFLPAKGWFGSDLTEKVEGWQTKVFEAAGKMVMVRRLKTPYNLPKDATFKDYIEQDIPQDIQREDNVNPLSANMLGGPSGGPKGQSVAPMESAGPADLDALGAPNDLHSHHKKDTKDSKAKKPKRVTARCWMAENFPLSLRQLMPLLEVMSSANKHLAKVSKFMNKFGDMNLFPVKVQVPLMMTVYVLLAFKEFTILTPKVMQKMGPDFFKVPEDYKRGYLEDFTTGGSSSNPSYHPQNGELDKDPFGLMGGVEDST